MQGGVGLVGWDRLGIRVRAGVLWNRGDNSSDDPLLDRDHRRRLLELQVDYRFMPALIGGKTPVYVSFGVGGSLYFDIYREKQLSLTFDDPTCDPSAERCEAGVFADRTTRRDTTGRPLVTAGLNVGKLLVSYGFQPDFADISDSTHRLLAGFRF